MRRWRLLLNLIDHLPSASHFAEAQGNDEELAEAWLTAQGGEVGFRPRLAEWTPAVAELTNIADRIAENTAVLLAANSKGQQRAPEPRPRPETAIERVRHRLREAQHNRLTRRLLPHKYSDPG